MTTSSPLNFPLLLKDVLRHQTQEEVAKALNVDARTVRRWKAGESEPPAYLTHALCNLFGLKRAQGSWRDARQFKFIDLFAGVGGIRTAFEDVGGRCIFTSEWDDYAQKTYIENYAYDEHRLNGDITNVKTEEIPEHDVLLAGFPCQPFSIAGVSKKNALGRAHGFKDETQGTLFFDVARIIADKQPKAFLLENVKNLLSHDKGRTFEVIKRTLTEELGYHIFTKVVDGAHFTPQHRERILIVGFKAQVDFKWEAIGLPPKGARKLKDILHKTDGSEPYLEWDGDRFFDHQNAKVLDKYTLTPKLWIYLQDYAAKHKAKGNGFGFGLVGPESVTRTLSARYYKDGSEILVSQGEGKNPRRLTPRECARLMGFDDSFKIPVSDMRAYKQFGNSVVVDVMRYAAQLMLPFIVDDQKAAVDDVQSWPFPKQRRMA